MNNPDRVEKHIETASGTLFYYHNNSFPHRPTVVLLHGLSSNHTTWDHLCTVLHQKKFNSLAVELRGHGKSDKRKQRHLYQWPVFTDDLECILQRENITKPILVGYSYGGPIAINYSFDHPHNVAKLVLISTNYQSPPVYMHLGLLTPVCYWLFQMVGWLTIWQGRREYIYYQHNKSRSYVQSVWVGFNTMPFAINMWMFSQMFTLNFKETLLHIPAQTLIIRGKNDPFVSAAEAEEMAHRFPHARLQTTHYAGHFVASKSQDEITDMIVKFIEE